MMGKHSTSLTVSYNVTILSVHQESFDKDKA